MKRITAIIAAAFLIATLAFSLSVDEDELRSVDQSVSFENYSGKHDKVDTLDQIKQIGIGLGEQVASDRFRPGTKGNRAKYSVIHAIDLSVKEGLDADILVLGPDAMVDHIRNLRHIIAGYLRAAYGYSERDAETIAVFVTVYNAVYRSDMDTFRSKYKSVVIRNLTPASAGLSTKYNEWPGRSQIVIPLNDIVGGGISTIDTTTISDRNVIESMRESPDKNVDDRKNMLNIKDREAQQATQKAQDAQKEATDKQNKVVEETKILEDKKKETKLAEEKEKAAQQKAKDNPTDKDAKKEADKAKKEADKARQEEKQQQEKVERAQKQADEAKKTAAEQQAFADIKQAETQTDRREIAKDVGTLPDEEEYGMYGLVLSNSSKLTSTIVRFNAENSDILQESKINTIRNRVMYEIDDGFIAIAGDKPVKLVIIDQRNLEIIKETEEDLSENSVLLQEGKNYVVVISDGSLYVVARYDEKLKLVKKSSVAVNPDTPIVKTSDGYIVTNIAGRPIILDTSSLEKK